MGIHKRYENTEREFLTSYINITSKKPHSVCIHIKEILKMTNRSESTFHRHYHSIDEIVTKKEKKVLKEYQSLLQKFRQKNPTLRQITRSLLFFIRSNQEFFSIILMQNNQDFFEHFMGKLKPFIKRNWFDNDNKIYRLCVGEIFLVLKSWGDQDFDIDELGKAIEDIIYLIETAKPRLGPLQH